MGKYNEIENNLITLALQGKFDVITHGCNCFCQMGAGIAPQMAKAFGCDKFPLEDIKYRGDINKLGCIDYQTHTRSAGTSVNDIFTFDLTVVNSYTQYHYGKNHLDGKDRPIDYEALTMCMRKLNHKFAGKHIGLPKIGSGLAGGVWSIDELSIHDQNTRKDLPNKDIKSIIQSELKNCNITIVIYKP